ncbi:hypothetical protein GS399_14930 [Pedobacter sp. HMF7647]|uniref:DUF3300 domain-containing protein n=1 Tax=Hufsiella arboris TaxID=2695275 RepID=A0A7K1YCV6_9SPHI|nr:hypothetical protein [Hufsiella arboris]MXV52270.1 hypothetical protein [Hufsiella arboris]
MKKLLIMSALVLSSFVYKAADAQIRINVNIGNQPEWGPYGYDRADYYYLPEIGAYYNVAQRNYTYQQGNRWVTKTSLPSRYKNYDLYRSYKVVINDRNPWINNNVYSSRYGSYRNRHDQRSIRDYNNNAKYARDNDRDQRRDNRWDGHDNRGKDRSR